MCLHRKNPPTTLDRLRSVKAMLKVLTNNAQVVLSGSDVVAVIHYNAKTDALGPWYWPRDPITLELIPLEKLEELHLDNVSFKFPCCICAYVDDNCYTECTLRVINVVSSPRSPDLRRVSADSIFTGNGKDSILAQAGHTNSRDPKIPGKRSGMSDNSSNQSEFFAEPKEANTSDAKSLLFPHSRTGKRSRSRSPAHIKPPVILKELMTIVENSNSNIQHRRKRSKKNHVPDILLSDEDLPDLTDILSFPTVKPKETVLGSAPVEKQHYYESCTELPTSWTQLDSSDLVASLLSSILDPSHSPDGTLADSSYGFPYTSNPDSPSQRSILSPPFPVSPLSPPVTPAAQPLASPLSHSTAGQNICRPSPPFYAPNAPVFDFQLLPSVVSPDNVGETQSGLRIQVAGNPNREEGPLAKGTVQQKGSIAANVPFTETDLPHHPTHVHRGVQTGSPAPESPEPSSDESSESATKEETAKTIILWACEFCRKRKKACRPAGEGDEACKNCRRRSLTCVKPFGSVLADPRKRSKLNPIQVTNLSISRKGPIDLACKFCRQRKIACAVTTKGQTCKPYLRISFSKLPRHQTNKKERRCDIEGGSTVTAQNYFFS
ncbi:hypothetical protein FA15DRAFT_654745 [Coprinopsis marcescibilis]|uniref:Zn(2)-C6 fungal-type domain-containing protein n=1 Tax=Coprinopsis marcescibilis TaxID=230819 RepID=A0A5C3KZV9_COPMA|nr:hypothetical protein FA15DRAFT_654745 [Coprinopsis marcescibilis]